MPMMKEREGLLVREVYMGKGKVCLLPKRRYLNLGRALRPIIEN